MSVEPSLWNTLTKVVIALLVIAAAGAVVVWFQPVINSNEQMRKKVFQLDHQIAKEEAEQRQLRAAIDSLKRDAKAVERCVRESLAYAKPGETIFRFTNTPAAR
jgi:cell division protein FtsB